jgi:hypothetical protein
MNESGGPTGPDPTRAEGEGSPVLPPPPADQTPVEEPAGQPPLHGPAKPRRTLWVLLVAAALVVVVGIVAGIMASSGGEETVALASSPTTPASPTEASPPLAPVGFHAEAGSSPFEVNLSWLAPSGGAEVTGYRLFRGTAHVASLPASVTEYTDASVTPGQSYTYHLESLNGVSLVSDQVSAQIDVPLPPLKDARLEGIFNVAATPTSQYGYGSTIEKGTAGWNFAPKCDEGACNVTWNDLQFKKEKVLLHKKGPSYKGTDKSKFGVTCRRVEVVSTITIDIRVVKAKVIGGEWLATKVVGTLKQTEPSQLGCGSSGVTFKIVANQI